PVIRKLQSENPDRRKRLHLPWRSPLSFTATGEVPVPHEPVACGHAEEGRPQGRDIQRFHQRKHCCEGGRRQHELARLPQVERSGDQVTCPRAAKTKRLSREPAVWSDGDEPA